MSAQTSTVLWTAREAALATGGTVTADAVWTVGGVSIDTRTVSSGDLFVALKGPNFDGHDYVAPALSKGAAAAMVTRAPADADPSRLLAVPDTQAGLEALAIAARARSAAKIVAVTGSVGKTGTKEALATVLGGQGATHASSGNLNNQIGMPLSLARMPAASRFGVFEIGMNHAGEIAPLSAMLRPHAAIVTTVEAVHLEHFPDVAAIADAKAEIFTGLDRDGVAILNRDNVWFDRLTMRATERGVGRIWSFGSAADATARLTDIVSDAAGSVVSATVLGRPVRFHLPLPGRHQAQNALAVLLGVAALDGDVAMGAAALEALAPVKGRGVTTEVMLPGGGAFRVVDETYNASPAAVRAVLAVFGMTPPQAPGGRRLVVLGDMLELGGRGPAEHAGLADALLAARVDGVFTAGPLSRHLHDALPLELRGVHAADSTVLATAVAGAVQPGDIVLVKGSAGSRMAAVVSALLALSAGNAGSRHAV
jgi:UDP-N-acetylmuramoyl-tripeptide--D-alanyl-D-alanine ligase